MHGREKIINAAYWLGLTIWVAALASGGVAAIGVFTTLPAMGLRISEFEPHLGDDTREHGRLAGGKVMEPIFTATDYVQCATATITCIALALILMMNRRAAKRPANLVRTTCIGIAAALLVYHMIDLAPGMNRELRAYWSAARQVDHDAAKEHKASFDANHPTADALYKARLMLLLIAVAASGAACVSEAKRTLTSPLQTPELAKLK